MNFHPTHLLPLASSAVMHAATNAACIKQLGNRWMSIGEAVVASPRCGAVGNEKIMSEQAQQAAGKRHFSKRAMWLGRQCFTEAIVTRGNHVAGAGVLLFVTLPISIDQNTITTVAASLALAGTSNISRKTPISWPSGHPLAAG